MKVDGGCHCGFITYEAEIDPEKVMICNCTDCQRLSGSSFRRLCLESGGNWFWRFSERVEFCGGQATRSRVSSAIS